MNLTPEAITLCLSLFGGHPITGACHDGPGGLSWFAITTAAIGTGRWDSTGGCPVTKKGTVTGYCPPPSGKECFVVVRFSSPGYPNGVVYLCREPEVS